MFSMRYIKSVQTGLSALVLEIELVYGVNLLSYVTFTQYLLCIFLFKYINKKSVLFFLS